MVPIVKEFYANMLGQEKKTIWVRNALIRLDLRVINTFYNLPSDVECEYSKLIANMTDKTWNKVLKALTIEGTPWANEEGRVINRIDIKLVAKVWVKFLKYRMMPTTHTTTVSQERLVLLYVIVQGLPLDVGAIIQREIRECAMKQHKTITLLFPSLITSLCLVSRVWATIQDEHIKNAGALNA